MLSKGVIDILQKAQTPMELPEFLNHVQSFLDSNFKGHAKDVSFLKFIENVIARAPVESPPQSEFLLRATSYGSLWTRIFLFSMLFMLFLFVIDAFLFSLRKTALSVHKAGFVRGSIFMPENPSVCEDVMRHVFDHCDSRTIQRYHSLSPDTCTWLDNDPPCFLQNCPCQSLFLPDVLVFGI
jgi:hypothetical protein